ncbi:MAG: hypothetical protein HOQ24_12270, partial [Mycobacteriaceae bacterium]|nr:hypothetical protein [Mycobacteriaceae bacterium]
MTIRVVAGLPECLVTVAAGHFPQADETALRLLAVAWQESAETSRRITKAAADLATAVREHAASAATNALARGLDDQVRAMPGQAEFADGMAGQLNDTADGVEFTKLLINTTLVAIAGQLAVDVTLLGAGLLKAAADRAAAKSAVAAAQRSLLARIIDVGARAAAGRAAARPGRVLAVGAALGIGFGAATNAYAQQRQHELGHRPEFDLLSL